MARFTTGGDPTDHSAPGHIAGSIEELLGSDYNPNKMHYVVTTHARVKKKIAQGFKVLGEITDSTLNDTSTMFVVGKAK